MRGGIALAAQNSGLIFAAVGIHPHEAARADAPALARLEELARSPGVVAVGETGLDYHRERARAPLYDRSPRETQKAVFEAHVRLALKLDLPVVEFECDYFHDFSHTIAKPRSILGYNPQYDIFKIIDEGVAFRKSGGKRHPIKYIG